MLYEEFCKGVGEDIAYAYYKERVEPVYGACDRFSDKRKLYRFYKKHGKPGIEAEFAKIAAKLTHERREEKKQNIPQAAAIYQELNGLRDKYAALSSETEECFTRLASHVCPLSPGDRIRFPSRGDVPLTLSFWGSNKYISVESIVDVEFEVVDILPSEAALRRFYAAMWAHSPNPEEWKTWLFEPDVPLYCIAVSPVGFGDEIDAERIALTSGEMLLVEKITNKTGLRGKNFMSPGYGKKYNVGRFLLLQCISACVALEKESSRYTKLQADLQNLCSPFSNFQQYITDSTDETGLTFRVERIQCVLGLQADAEAINKDINALGGRMFAVSGKHVKNGWISGEQERHSTLETLTASELDRIEALNNLFPITLAELTSFTASSRGIPPEAD